MHIRDMLTGYARVSTDDQDLRLQRGLLTEAGCRRIFEEKGSGASRDRPELARLLDQIRADDVVVLTVFAGIAEFERALIHQRTSSGRVAVRARGVRFGRPPKLTTDQIALGLRLVGEGTSMREAAKLLQCHHAPLYRALTAASLRS
jgi:DNA invertase Pin-like site-specific DNA recombinase